MRRPALSRHHPAHVTLRVAEGVPNLRRPKLYRAVEDALREGCDRFGMRIVHYSVQRNHIHFIAEASNARALARGLQGLTIRIAKRVNKQLARKGKLFAERYHARALKTPTETRTAIRYVLQNGHKHAIEQGGLPPEGAIDSCSSARYFDGYANRSHTLVTAAWNKAHAPPVRPPQTWLLTKGWRRQGLLHTDDLPDLPNPRRHHTPR